MSNVTLQSHTIVDTYTLRRLSASAVRFRLGQQLDWRLDLMLDATGLHLLNMRGLYALNYDGQVATLFSVVEGDDGINHVSEMTESPWPDAEIVVRTKALLKIPFTQEPLEVGLDLRLRDYAALPAPDTRGVEGVTRRRATDNEGRAVEMTVRGADFLPDRDTVFPTQTAMKKIIDATPRRSF